MARKASGRVIMELRKRRRLEAENRLLRDRLAEEERERVVEEPVLEESTIESPRQLSVAARMASAPTQAREVSIPKPLSDVRQDCIDALNTIGATIQSVEQNIINATVGITWRSWGTRIQIRLSEQGEDTQVHIGLRAAAGIAIIDWGQNVDLAEKIVSLLSFPPSSRLVS